VVDEVVAPVAELKGLEEVEHDPRQHEAFAQEAEEEEVLVAKLLEDPHTPRGQLVVKPPDRKEREQRPRGGPGRDFLRRVLGVADHQLRVDLEFLGAEVEVVGTVVEGVALAAHHLDLTGGGVEVFLIAVAVLVQVLQRVEVVELPVFLHFGFHLHFPRLALLAVLSRTHVY